jgi:hypothetical protein
MLPRRTNLRLLWRRPGRLAFAYWPALAALGLAALADGLTTWHNLRQFGPEVELHPAQRIVSHILGVTAGVPVAKLIQLGFVVAVACWWRPWCAWLLWGCAALYALAALSNHFHWL